MVSDSSGNLWVGSQTPYLVKLNNSLEAERIIDLSGQGPDNYVSRILRDHQGRILFSTRYGIFYITDDGVGEISRQYKDARLKQDGAANIYALTAHEIVCWPGGNIDREPKRLARKTGLKRFQIQSWTINHPTGEGELLFRNIWQLSDNRTLLYTSGGFLIFSDNNYHWITLDDLGIRSGNDVFVQDNRIWLTSRQGTYRMEAAGHEITGVEQITTTNDNSVYVDSEGSIWIGTANEGIRQLVLSPFKIYSKSDGLASNAILATLEDRHGGRWIGTNCEGLNRITPAGNTLYDATDGMLAECVWSLAETSDGRIWASNRRVVYYDPKTDQFNPAPFKDQLQPSRYRALFADSNQNLWMGTLGKGMARWDGNELTYFTTDDGLPSNHIRMFYEDKSQMLWIATEKGIARIADTTHPNPQKVEAAGDFYYRAIMRDERGLFWFGSYGNGITIFNKTTGDITRITTENGLSENVASQIAEDQRGNIWLGGNMGIYVLPATSVREFLKGQSPTIHVISFGTDDGLRTAETVGGFQPAWQHTSEGNILFSTVNGLVEINPSVFKTNNNPPPLYLKKVMVGNKAVSQTGPFTFSYDDRRIQFQYSVLSYKNPNQIQVEYQMRGFDTEWQQAEGNRRITYTSLPPGNYTFKVRAANAFGVWNDRGISVPVVVKAPFWQKSWFIGLVLLVSGGFVYGGFRLRVSYLRNRSRELEHQVKEHTHNLAREKQTVEKKNQIIARQNQELEELNRMKDRFITGISHEFRTPLTLIFGSLEMAKEQLNHSDPGEIEEHLQRIGAYSQKLHDLVDQFLELSRLEAGMSVIHKSTMCLTKFSAGITSAFTSLAEQKKIDYQVHLPDDTVWFEADRPKLEMAINNILKNAFKYTDEKGTITYRLIPKPESEQAIISISDTGEGIDPEDQPQIFDRFYQAGNEFLEMGEGTGIGLAVSREIVELHGGSISVDSQKGEGSTFNLVLPMLDLNLSREETRTLLDTMPPDPGPMETDVPKSPTNPEEARQILVIEDNVELRTFIKKRLGDTYIMLEASDGNEGLAKAREHLPDLIISDVMMPNMDGYTFCQKLRKDPEITFLPVILLTARAGKEDEIAGLEAGADEYIKKPFDTKMLKVRVDNLIRRRMELRKQYLQDGLLLPDTSGNPNPFQQKLNDILKSRLSDPGLSVQVLAEEVGLSRRQLLRKCKKELSKTPTEYIRHYRLHVAAELLKKQSLNVSEVAYAVGFNNLSLFSRYFKEWKGQSPSQHQNTGQKKGD